MNNWFYLLFMIAALAVLYVINFDMFFKSTNGVKFAVSTAVAVLWSLSPQPKIFG